MNIGNSRIKAVFIVGPTASGKTALAVELALALNGEVINADSMQIYKQLNIGAAKPTIAEQKGVPHHMLNVVSVGQDFSVSLYKLMATAKINEICQRGKLPIVCGGTGLFINALTYKLDFTKVKGNPELRRSLVDLLQQKGNYALHARLKQVDPITAEKLHPNDTKRIIRAIEVYELTGKPLSEQTKDFKDQQPADYDFCLIGLKWERHKLIERIEKRVDEMMQQGLYQEAKAVFAMGIHPGHPSLMGLGYRQLFEHFAGKMTLDEAVQRIKTETRQYAKRQMTWFNRDMRINWIEPEKYNSLSELSQAAQQIISNKLGIQLTGG